MVHHPERLRQRGYLWQGVWLQSSAPVLIATKTWLEPTYRLFLFQQPKLNVWLNHMYVQIVQVKHFYYRIAISR